MSSCTEGSVAEVGAHPTDEKCSSVSRAQSSWVGVDWRGSSRQPGRSWERVLTTPGELA